MTWRDRETIRTLEAIRAASGVPGDLEQGFRSDAAGLVGARIGSIDALRGAAIVFMAFSHLALTTGWFAWPSGWGFLVFIAVSGGLWKDRPLGRRYLELVVAAAVTAPMTAWLGLNAVNVLVAWALVLPLLRVTRRLEVLWVTVIAGIVYVEWWGISGGVNPGLVMLGWIAGRSAGLEGLARATRRFPRMRLLELVGRRPLTAYTAHVVGLVALRLLAG
jgi:hypothetical protein